MDSIDDHKYNKRPTQADVARLAEVSQAMVSYVNEIPSISISDETRTHVLDAVKTLGYVPDSAARSLKTRKSSTVAGIIPDTTNPFYPAFQRGIQDVAESRGYDLISCNTDGIAAREHKFLQLARQGRVDGFVAVFFHHELSLHVTGNRIEASIDGMSLFDVKDEEHSLLGGGIGLICEEGCLSSDAVTVGPAG